MSKYRFLGCHMLMANGKWFSALPMFGSLSPTDPIVPSEFFPWVFDRELASALPGGKALKWWHRLVQCQVVVSGSIHNGLDEVDVSFSATAIADRANVIDEHDVLMHPSYQQNYYWTGGSPVADPQRINIGNFDLMPFFPAGPTAFWLTNTHIAPYFRFSASLEFDPGHGPQQVWTYNPGPAFVVVGTFHFDGEETNLWGYPPASPTDDGINFMDITVTPTWYLSHNGVYDPATGLYASGVVTNRY